MKDGRVRYRPAELEAVCARAVRAFCLTNANLRGSEQAARLVANLAEITRIAAQPRPYIYGVYRASVDPLWPR